MAVTRSRWKLEKSIRCCLTIKCFARYVRIIDETGEDYLYPMKYFVPLSLSADVIGALTARSIDTNR